MNTDDRVANYLADRAATITLAPASPSLIVERARRRRQRRQRATIGCVAVASLAVGGLAVFDDDDSGSSVAVAAVDGVVPSSLEWHVVEPDIGLGLWATTVTADDGAVYSLSTAPGFTSAADTANGDPAHLYRSADGGAEWHEVALPDDLWASSLSAGGGRLYAVGTSPAGGGGREVVIASSADGGGNWSGLQALPMDELAALQAAHGADQISLSPPTVAAGPSGMVVAVSVHSVPDVPALAEAAGIDISENDAWSYTAEGVEVYELPEDPIAPSSTMPIHDTTPAGESGAPAPSREGDFAAVPTVNYTWDQLGLHPELRALIGGRLLVFSSTDGDAFQRATVPELGGGNARLLVAPDGYRLAFQSSGSTSSELHVLRSADGVAWEPDAIGAVSGYLVDAGQLDGRPALATGSDTAGDITIWSLAADGTWSATDLQAALAPAVGDGLLSFGPVAFGPQGFAALVAVFEDEDDSSVDWQLVHSSGDGVLSFIALRDHLSFDAVDLGVAVTADAIVVRANQPDDRSDMPHQVLLVGTSPG
jgi:hypothetical protein